MPDIPSTPIPDNLEKFELHCWARAFLFREGELGLLEAVDPLVITASKLGINLDLAQSVIATFFALARRP